MAEGLVRGVVGVSLWNIVIIGIIAVVAVIGYNAWIAGNTVAGVTLARA
jgi:hypothetical protein